MNEAQLWLPVNPWVRGRSHLYMGDSFRVSLIWVQKSKDCV